LCERKLPAALKEGPPPERINKKTKNEKSPKRKSKNRDFVFPELSGDTIKGEHQSGGQKAKANAPHDLTPLTQAARAL
jgi:hypothetical protein